MGSSGSRTARISKGFSCCVAAAGLLACPSSALAASETEEGAARDTQSTPGGASTDVPPLAYVAAVVPGFLVHGSGHFAAGRRDTAARLLAMEASGLGLVLAGGIPLALTGASRYIVGPAALSVIGGVGLFGMSFLSDLYGLAAPDGGTGAPLRFAPLVQSRLAYMYVYDPQFAYRNFAVTSADVRFDAVRLSPAIATALDDHNQRLRLGAAYRFTGPLPRARARDGSYLELEAAATRHTFPRLGFTANALELYVGGRLDFGRLDRHLRGSFGEMGAGVALRLVDYDEPVGVTDPEDVLLARLAYGLYLGGPQENKGEIMLYYDHRHDDFAAGLQMPGLGSGVAGHFGLSAEVYDQAFGVGADFQAGSAYIATLSILYRHWMGQ